MIKIIEKGSGFTRIKIGTKIFETSPELAKAIERNLKIENERSFREGHTRGLYDNY